MKIAFFSLYSETPIISRSLFKYSCKYCRMKLFEFFTNSSIR